MATYTNMTMKYKYISDRYGSVNYKNIILYSFINHMYNF